MGKVSQVPNGASGSTARSYWNEAVKSGDIETSDFKATAFDTDGTLSANSDTKIPSQKAVKTYVDTVALVVNQGTGTAGNNSVTPTSTFYIFRKTGITGGGDTVTLPDTSTISAGQIIIVKDDSGTAAGNNITVATFGAELIDGQATAIITADYGYFRFFWNGTSYNLI